MNKDISEKTLELIKNQDVHPRPRWQFAVREDLLWSLFGLVSLIGGAAVAATLYMTLDADWDYYQALTGNWIQTVFQYAPYIWIGLLLIMVVIGYGSIRYTKKGYKYSLWMVLGLSVVISLVFGGVIYANGGGERIDAYLAQNNTTYRRDFSMNRLWSHPESGRLSGTITEIRSGQVFILKDWNGKSWQVEWLGMSKRSRVNIELGQNIKILGKQKDSETFIAEELRPWQGSGYGQQSGKSGRGMHFQR